MVLSFNIASVYSESVSEETISMDMPNTTANMTVYKSPAYVELSKNHSSYIKISEKDAVHQDVPKISMRAKPSCGCRYSYVWYQRTFIDYCPHCKHYNVLRKNPKGVYEREYTCGVCGADYCGVCGKEKYSWSHYYLTRC